MLQAEIPQLEKEKQTLTEQLSKNISYETLNEISQRITLVTEQLELKEMRWLELSELI